MLNPLKGVCVKAYSTLCDLLRRRSQQPASEPIVTPAEPSLAEFSSTNDQRVEFPKEDTLKADLQIPIEVAKPPFAEFSSINDPLSNKKPNIFNIFNLSYGLPPCTEGDINIYNKEAYYKNEGLPPFKSASPPAGAYCGYNDPQPPLAEFSSTSDPTSLGIFDEILAKLRAGQSPTDDEVKELKEKALPLPPNSP